MALRPNLVFLPLNFEENPTLSVNENNRKNACFSRFLSKRLHYSRIFHYEKLYIGYKRWFFHNYLP